MARITLEVCVDSVAGIEAAVAGGADRIELCQALALGGLTPSRGLMERAAQLALPVYAMIRPRAGNFIYSDAEIDVMIDDIVAVQEAGLAGVVFGAMDEQGQLHRSHMAALANAADGIGTTLHRVVDVLSEPAELWLEFAIGLGIERVLTSGGAATAPEGASAIQQLVEWANGRISIMPGSGVRSSNVAALLKATAAREVHSSCASSSKIPKDKIDFGHYSMTDQASVAELRTILDGIA